ncbi:MAG: hypothetical protein WC554_16665 [Clostridia bacterium]|jgi:hypothetical protein
MKIEKILENYWKERYNNITVGDVIRIKAQASDEIKKAVVEALPPEHRHHAIWCEINHPTPENFGKDRCNCGVSVHNKMRADIIKAVENL